jgi:hypothetical protein
MLGALRRVARKDVDAVAQRRNDAVPIPCTLLPLWRMWVKGFNAHSMLRGHAADPATAALRPLPACSDQPWKQLSTGYSACLRNGLVGAFVGGACWLLRRGAVRTNDVTRSTGVIVPAMGIPIWIFQRLPVGIVSCRMAAHRHGMLRFQLSFEHRRRMR